MGSVHRDRDRDRDHFLGPITGPGPGPGPIKCKLAGPTPGPGPILTWTDPSIVLGKTYIVPMRSEQVSQSIHNQIVAA